MRNQGICKEMMLEMSVKGRERAYWERVILRRICTREQKRERKGNVWRRANSSVQLKHRILNEKMLLKWTTLQKAVYVNLRIWTSSIGNESF